MFCFLLGCWWSRQCTLIRSIWSGLFLTKVYAHSIWYSLYLPTSSFAIVKLASIWWLFVHVHGRTRWNILTVFDSKLYISWMYGIEQRWTNILNHYLLQSDAKFIAFALFFYLRWPPYINKNLLYLKWSILILFVLPV